MMHDWCSSLSVDGTIGKLTGTELFRATKALVADVLSYEGGNSKRSVAESLRLIAAHRDVVEYELTQSQGAVDHYRAKAKVNWSPAVAVYEPLGGSDFMQPYNRLRDALEEKGLDLKSLALLDEARSELEQARAEFRTSLG